MSFYPIPMAGVGARLLCLFGPVVLTVSVAMAQESSPKKPKAKPNTVLYRVAPGDHVAGVLRSRGYANLWGPQGSVARTHRLNPQLQNRQLNPGEWIYLPLRGKKKPASSLVQVTCPDGTVVETRAFFQQARAGQPASIHFAESAPCASRSPASQNLDITEGAPGTAKGIDITEDEIDGVLPITPVEPVTELPHTAHKDQTPPEEEKALSVRLGPRVGYVSQKYSIEGGNFSLLRGVSSGALLGLEWGNKKSGLGLNAFYETGNLGNAGVTSDKASVTDIGADLVWRRKKWGLHLGAVMSTVKTNFAGDTLKFSGTGLSLGLSHRSAISESWSAVTQLRASSLSFKKNAELLNDVTGQSLVGMLSFECQMGGNKP